jgi:predicted acylesterase/phospholipase RssA
MRRAITFIAFLAATAGCSGPPPRQSDAVGPLAVTALGDAEPPGDAVSVLAGRPPGGMRPEAAIDSRRFSVLALSGGGADGAYTAGALVGWSEAGTRPDFDVITGVSTGALIATLTFVNRDADLQRFYTTTTDADIFDRRSTLSALLSDAFADHRPLARRIEKLADDKFLAAVAAEHRKGRRLYVGTTHLDARRLVVWDMGAIAARGRPADVELFRKVLLASTAAPGFFPPVAIKVEVDGRQFEELHVDGAATAMLFFRPPQVPWAEAIKLGDRPLAGSDLYVLVAGKLYAEPDRAEPKLLPLLADSVSALVAAKTQADVGQLHATARSEGMHFHLGAIPPTVASSMDPLAFDPPTMTRLFDAGRRKALAGSLWRDTPPGAGPGEEVPDRTGAKLTTTGR